MSDDINKLIGRLRATYFEEKVFSLNDVRDAANALEALLTECDLVRSSMRSAVAERDRLKAQNIAWADQYGAALEERDRLKAALVPFAKLETWRGAHDPAEGTMRMRVVTVPEIEAAREALEAKE